MCLRWVAVVAWMALCMPAKVMASSTADDHTMVIDASTKLQDVFTCSRVHPIGPYNEYFVSCQLKLKDGIDRIDIQHVDLRATVLAPVAEFHVELEIALNRSVDTAIRLVNSTIFASAVHLEASQVLVDEASHVNVSVSGLKFGPGYNSWANMGGSYGGIAGAAMAGLLHRKCEDLAPLDFYRAIGDVTGDLGNFQGYGSGGGPDTSRGGGRVQIVAGAEVVVNGSILANGGQASTESYDSAGSGGTILIETGRLSGVGHIQANGGHPMAYDEEEDVGGGGGGGGGRVMVRYDTLDKFALGEIQAFGGGSAGPASPGIQWCQLGGDGTILTVQRSNIPSEDNNGEGTLEIGTLVLKGNRTDHNSPSKPVAIYGCTPIFEQTSFFTPFVPPYVAQLTVSGGATLCTTQLRLQPNVSTVNSSLVVEQSCRVTQLSREHQVHLSATHVSLQGYVGPTSKPSPHLGRRDSFSFFVEGSDVALANAVILSEDVTIESATGVMVDKYSTIHFRSSISIKAADDIQVLGLVQPDGDTEIGDPEVEPTILLQSQHGVAFTPQQAQVGILAIEIHAAEDATIDIPFATPLLRLFAAAKTLQVARVTGGTMPKCEAISGHADASLCSQLWSRSGLTGTKKSPYLLSLLGKEAVTIGNVSAGSVIACTDGGMSVEGRIIADSLGCKVNKGPGSSVVISEASGGAGHGGKGGNVEPGNAGGGKIYDRPSEIWSEVTTDWPVWPGSGAATGGDDDGSDVSIAGGNGGGMIHVSAKQLRFINDKAIISARGGSGAKNGGGGAGGAIVLMVGELDGPGMIDVTGGTSVKPTSVIMGSMEANKSVVWDPTWAETPVPVMAPGGAGGGGGGIIRTFFRGDVPDTRGNGEDFVKNGGQLVMIGGKGNGGEDGGKGFTASMNCSTGRGGALCLECDEGAYSPLNASSCLPCEPGSFSDHKGVASCDKCAKGTFNTKYGEKTCTPCEAGTFTNKVGAKTCSPCLPGSFADKPGSSKCALCPIGAIAITAGSTNCTVCGIGETTAKPGALICEGCTYKPEHASFNVHGNCSYACEKGRTGLDCLTPFERFVKPIGGTLGFILLVLGFTAAVFGSWGLITYRTSRDRESKQRYAKYKAQTIRDQLSLTNLTRNLTPRLTDQDVAIHLTRIFFDGENHLSSSWRLNPYVVPAPLRDLVQEDSYLSFASSCNQLVLWPQQRWEFWVHRILLVIVPPGATMFMRRRQLSRVERIAKFITQYSGGFYRELSFRVPGVQLKIGFSPDFSLAYIDVVGTSTSSNPLPSASQGRNGHLLVVAGSGSFFRPYFIDTNDVLVRAVPSRLHLLHHHFWIDFIAEANQKLRMISQPSSEPRRQRALKSIQDVCTFVDDFNQRHNNDGLHVRFGSFVMGEHFQPFVDPSMDEQGEIGARLEMWRDESLKFAFEITKTSTSNSAPSSPRQAVSSESGSPNSDPNSSGPRESRLSIESDPRSVEFRYSQIRMQALFAPSSSSPVTEEAEPLYPEKPSRRRSGSGSPRAQQLYQLCSSQSVAFQWVSVLCQPVAPLFRLRNARPRLSGSHLIWPLSTLLLVVCDIVVAFWVLMEYYCIQVDDPTAHDSGCSRAGLASVSSVLPLAQVGTPLLGLFFLARKSILYGKLFAVWTIGSMVNLVVALLCAVVYIDYIHESVILVIVAGLLLKVLEKEAALQCIAQYTTERPLRGWRGLHTTKDWYDAAYTPLIHHVR
ncbi:hypothetical protein Poli38472_009833 [Pythium oligandrum]|uniref:Tyrosine-protein kinase ephrin type A/B receptor-like domain-containing protein n=1 Tax=Pythium oligandrum TaxID=41045 RepID=A0A8K1FG36_PYTOL|nr:hypothetical protein Poli38472_009833 [Pythium oligandrum]|eukprot:TMW62340.1 hypothetical protein Poli38472_009833 [Pythium oligandrum]